MKKMLTFALSLGIIFPMFLNCSKYDDSALWDQADKIYNKIDSLKPFVENTNNQVKMINAICQGGVVTNIGQDTDGNYEISYKGSDNLEHTLILALPTQISGRPVVGTTEKDGKLYWTLTSNGKTEILKDVDGSELALEGRAPEIGIDKDGYWTVNNVPIRDSKGDMMASEGKSVSVVTSISVASDKAVFTLGNGKTIEAPFDTFNVRFKYNGQYFLTECIIASAKDPAIINYEFVGEGVADAVLRVMRYEGLTITQNSSAKTLTITPGAEFEEGSFTVVAGCGNDRSIIKVVSIVTADAIPEYYGIKTADDMVQLAKRVNTGKKLDRFKDTETGEIILLNDIDMTGVTDWMGIGSEDIPFMEVFNGKGFTIKNINFTVDVSAATSTGLFAYADGATIKDVTVGSTGSTITTSGVNKGVTYVGGIVGTAKNTTFTNCTNNCSVKLSGSPRNDTRFSLAGICGLVENTTITNCTNNGNVSTDKVPTNLLNTSEGIQTGGIAAYITTGLVEKCTNAGTINCPTGRSGGIVASADDCDITECINNGTVEDDVVGQFTSSSSAYNYKRQGGICGATTSLTMVKNCINNGNVIGRHSCRTGGIVGHNLGKIDGCTNNGSILADAYSPTSGETHGAGWLAGYNKSKSSVTNNRGCGRVGKFSTYGSNPANAPHASLYNAISHSNEGSYNPETNWECAHYFAKSAWTQKEKKSLATGVTYYKYTLTSSPREFNVIEMDLAANSKIHLEAVISDDIVPNPNWNNNSNNGKKIRETLSDIAKRKTNAGENIVAGINAGFFDSHDGLPRGFQVSDGELVYINGPWTRLPNHKWGFHVFSDRTTSCNEKNFRGYIKIGSKEHEYYSVNDTIVRKGGTSNYGINVYTHRYKEKPHSGYSQTNPLAKKGVYYIIAQYTGSAMTSGNGYVTAKVTKVIDGTSSSITPTYVSKGSFGICVHKDYKDIAAIKAVKVGDSISIKGEVIISGQTDKRVYNTISSMFQFVRNGNNESSAAASHASYQTYDPVTIATCDKNGTKVWFIQVDGREDWKYLGLTPFAMAELALAVGGYNMTRFDGGGSSCMWVKGEGIVGHPADRNGERSCMNYYLVRIDK
ncbi:MAG: phosphodiester glycosidase family protein [Bacteroidales bacterium]|nr:phosphodiester glycosidase family protein [Bacteroidales bacterium]